MEQLKKDIQNKLGHLLVDIKLIQRTEKENAFQLKAELENGLVASIINFTRSPYELAFDAGNGVISIPKITPKGRKSFGEDNTKELIDLIEKAAKIHACIPCYK